MGTNMSRKMNQRDYAQSYTSRFMCLRITLIPGAGLV